MTVGAPGRIALTSRGARSRAARGDHARESRAVVLPLVLVLRVTRHECRTPLLINMGRSYKAGRNPFAIVTVTLSCSL
jgi:hypothetical protein